MEETVCRRVCVEELQNRELSIVGTRDNWRVAQASQQRSYCLLNRVGDVININFDAHNLFRDFKLVQFDTSHYKPSKRVSAVVRGAFKLKLNTEMLVGATAAVCIIPQNGALVEREALADVN
jgi:hypothetical protein